MSHSNIQAPLDICKKLNLRYEVRNYRLWPHVF